MEMEITNTIQDIGEIEWNNLVGTDKIEQSYNWYKTVEESGMKKMHYITLKEGKTLKAAACCHVYTRKVYTAEISFLEVGSPLGAATVLFAKTPQEMRMLFEGLEVVQDRENTKGLLILDLEKKQFDAVKNEMKGFTEIPMPENTYIDLNFKDFDDYLSSLDGKARRSVRITLNKAKRLNIKPMVTNEFCRWRKVAHRLQGYTCEDHKDYSRHLPEQFYCAFERNLKDNAELLFFFKEGIPLAFVLTLHTPEVAHYKFPGVDPKYRQYHAYFLLYYEGIRRAIEKNQKRIYFGITSYAFKEKIGCKRERLYGLVKMRNPLLQMGLKGYLRVSRSVEI